MKFIRSLVRTLTGEARFLTKQKAKIQRRHLLSSEGVLFILQGLVFYDYLELLKAIHVIMSIAFHFESHQSSII